MAGRIKIGPYRPLDGRTPAVPGGGYINVDANVGKFEPSPLANLGLDVAQGLPAIAATVAEQLPRDNEAAVKVADTRLGETEQALLFDPQTGYFNTQGEAALTQAPEVLDAYGKAQQREVDALPNDAQRQMLEELTQRRLTTFGEQVERHSAAERLRWYDQASDRRIAQMQADAGFYWSDDALLRRALGTARAEVRDRAERHGWDSPLTEAALRQQTSRTLVSAIEAAVERDPGRAQALRTRYAAVIEDQDRAALDALLAEAQTRQRAQVASTEILNATPPDGEQATPQWRLRQAEGITDPDVRAATVRRVLSAAAAAEARARALGEQVLARVLKDHLTDPSQIPVREWVALDAQHRQAIETRLEHNARGTEPAANPALVDQLAIEMTQVPHAFARRDLVPSVARLPMAQWQRFRDWQAGLRRNDPTTEDELYAIRRGLQIARKVLPADTPDDDSATNYRAELVEEIDTWRRVNRKSPSDNDIAAMLTRHVPIGSYAPRTLEWDPRDQSEFHQTAGGDSNRLGGRLGPTVRRLTRGAVAAGRILWGSEPQIAETAAALGYIVAKSVPGRVNTQGQTFFYNPLTEQYITASPYELGYWLLFDALGRFLGVYSIGLDTVVPRDQLPPELEKEWTKPEIFPQAKPMPPLPGSLPDDLVLPQEGYTPAPPLKQPEGLTRPELELPPYLEWRTRPRNDGEPWEWHHHIPQELWRHDKPKRFPFSQDAVDFFKKETVLIPKDEHWSDLHDAYNRTFRRALKEYLRTTKKADETEEDFAGRMTRKEARECYKYVIDAILNPKKGLIGKEAEDAKDAKEFLENVSVYVRK